VSFKIWKKAGLIAYSSHSHIIGTTYPVTEELKNAWSGKVVAKFDNLGDKEDELERAAGRPLLEIYSPIREPQTGKIIAVAEFYETADALVKILDQAKVTSWFVVAGATLIMMLTLSGIVMRGSRTIEKQRRQLESKVEDLSVLLSQNEELRDRLQEISGRVAELNERNLGQFGASLHDGPAQLIGYSLLLLDPLRTAFKNGSPGRKEPQEISSIERALGDAMKEIRELSAGLTLAKLEEMSPLKVLSEIVRAHEKWTETEVLLSVDSVPDALPLSQKISVFRFVQESLNNAYLRDGGVKQTVHCQFEGHYLEVKVSDGNPGASQAAVAYTKDDRELGLTELRDRIESLGATLQVASIPGKGRHLTMRCRVA
jgi:signal transduction histidine kinase